jgi:hypothetical protein
MMSNHTVENDYDDLTVIKGIKDTRQNWLRDTLQVHTLSDLAELSVDEVMAHLPEGQIVSRSQIESWIRQAKHLSGTHQPKAQPPKRENGWHPFASFVVEFQQRDDHPDEKRTTVHYMEADASHMWAGQETEALCRWIAEQLPGTKPGGFSDKLQRLVAKAQPGYTPQAPTVPRPAPSKPSEPGFSDKLQAVMAKTRSLTSNRS